MDAAKRAKDVDHAYIRNYAERFLMENVKWDYQKWFDDLYKVCESSVDSTQKGWYWLRDEDGKALPLTSAETSQPAKAS